MKETVLAALISLAGTMAGAWLANRKSMALIAYRIEQLERRVEKHNRVIERTYELEKGLAVMKEELKEVRK